MINKVLDSTVYLIVRFITNSEKGNSTQILSPHLSLSYKGVQCFLHVFLTFVQARATDTLPEVLGSFRNGNADVRLCVSCANFGSFFLLFFHIFIQGSACQHLLVYNAALLA